MENQDEDYGDELDEMVTNAQKKIEQKTTQKKSMLQSALEAQNAQDPLESMFKQAKQAESAKPSEDTTDFDKLMSEMLKGAGGEGSVPDMAQFAEMFGKMGGDSSKEPDFGGLMKEFEKISKDNPSAPADPFAKLFEGLGSGSMPGGDDA